MLPSLKAVSLLLILNCCNAYPLIKTWTLNELSRYVETNLNLDSGDINYEDMDPSTKAVLDAFNEMMNAMFTGRDDKINALMKSPTGQKTWTKEQLKAAVSDPKTNPDFQPFIAGALQRLFYINTEEGKNKDSIEVFVPALDISEWTVQDEIKALKDPNTKPEQLSYLEEVKKQIEEASETGDVKEIIYIITPVGLFPQEKGIEPTIVSKKLADSN